MPRVERIVYKEQNVNSCFLILIFIIIFWENGELVQFIFFCGFFFWGCGSSSWIWDFQASDLLQLAAIPPAGFQGETRPGF